MQQVRCKRCCIWLDSAICGAYKRGHPDNASDMCLWTHLGASHCLLQQIAAWSTAELGLQPCISKKQL